MKVRPWLNALLNIATENRVTVVAPLKMTTSIGGGTVLSVDLTQVPSNSIFAVTLTQTGGSAGTNAAYCSFTYTVTNLGGAQLTTAAAPLNSRARIFKVQCVAGTKGTAFYNTSGTVVLWDCDEVMDQTNCS
jgi:hypothetical protein